MQKIISAIYIAGGNRPSPIPATESGETEKPLPARYALEHDDLNDCWMVRDGIMIGARFRHRQHWWAERYVAMLNKREDERRKQALKQAA